MSENMKIDFNAMVRVELTDLGVAKLWENAPTAIPPVGLDGNVWETTIARVMIELGRYMHYGQSDTSKDAVIVTASKIEVVENWEKPKMTSGTTE